jgi:hypothetical protein
MADSQSHSAMRDAHNSTNVYILVAKLAQVPYFRSIGRPADNRKSASGVRFDWRTDVKEPCTVRQFHYIVDVRRHTEFHVGPLRGLRNREA